MINIERFGFWWTKLSFIELELLLTFPFNNQPHFKIEVKKCWSREMEKLLSIKKDLKSVPESYILPSDSRPGNTVVPLCETIPVIDLKGEPTKIIEQIIYAGKEFGFFQVLDSVILFLYSRFKLVIRKASHYKLRNFFRFQYCSK